MLTAGTRLGPYEILAPLGAGGMGEVFRARDTRLDRTVAIKVLPAHLSHDPELRQRFEREARAVSSLNHPHICTLFDVGQQDGIDFLVMEYLEGETLADRLNKGAPSLDETLRIATQIADALDKAHRQGILHRDLKPGNIMLTRHGAKLMDFGLAKPAAPMAAAGVASFAQATRSQPLTAAGTLVGTYQYMAPEQLEGREADARSDVFAFGCVLYEMATGRRPFDGKTSASVIAAILATEPPPITQRQPLSPPHFERLVRACLAKDPDERLQTAHDVKLQLQWIAEGAGTAAAAAAPRSRRAWLGWSIAAVLAVVAMALAAALWRQPQPSSVHARLVAAVPTRGSGAFGMPAVSPDGSRIVFVGMPQGRRSLWLRAINSESVTELPGTQDASYPFWAPDGKAIGYFASGKLLRLDLSTGGSQVICDAAPDPRGGTWSATGEILFVPRRSAIVMKVSAAGGEPVPATKMQSGFSSHRWPVALPGGSHFVYLASPAGTATPENTLRFAALDGSEDLPLARIDSNAVYAGGQLLYHRGGNLIAQPFDAREGRFTGEAQVLATGVLFDPLFSFFAVSASDSVLAFASGSSEADFTLQWYDRTGKPLQQFGPPGTYGVMRLSPDGARLAYNSVNALYVADLKRGTTTRFSFEGKTRNRFPVWSPDGKHIAFLSDPGGTLDILVKPSDGSGQARSLGTSAEEKFLTDWSPDGRYLINTPLRTELPVEAQPLDGGKPVTLISGPKKYLNARVSPDGRWLLYESDEGGRFDIYIVPFMRSGGKWQVSTAGGGQPVWSRNGKEVFYISPDDKLMSVAVRSNQSGLDLGAPRELFALHPRRINMSAYDVAPDGRFLVNTDSSSENSTPIVLVVHWTADLKKP